jgi:hypothetical protein
VILLLTAALVSACHVTRAPGILPALSDTAICARFGRVRGAVEVRLSRNGVANARLVRSDRVVAETATAVSGRELRTVDIDQLAADLVRAAKKAIDRQ